MNPELSADLSLLIRYDWENEDQVADIAKRVRTYVVDLEERCDRLDKVEEILNKLEADGKTDVLKHFEALKVQ